MGCVSEKWPYVTGDGRESDDHTRMKNLAIHWLTEHGVPIKAIQTERQYPREESWPGFTDVYAEWFGIEVFIECKSNSWINRNSFSKGLSGPVKDGEICYIFNPDGVFLVEQEKVVVDDGRGGEAWRKVPQWEKVDELPMVDLRNFN